MYLQFCNESVGAKKHRRVQIELSDNCLSKGESNVTKETLMKSKYNVYIEGGWQMNIDK